MSNKNFVQRCLKGEILSFEVEDEFDNAVDEWHEADTDKKLYEFLGMTKEQYDLVIEQPESLNYVLFAKEHGMNIHDASIYLGGDQLAARGCDSETGKKILKWLKIKGKV